LAYTVKDQVLSRIGEEAASLRLTAAQAIRAGMRITPDGQPRSLKQLLSHKDIGFDDLARIWPQLHAWPAFAREQIEIDAAYHGYLDRQDADVALFRREEALRLPEGLNYADLGGLSNEVKERLTAIRPGTIGQAARIEGVTPGAITALLAHVRRRAS
jgi:tRNA uridine 5-carboxymethylaminomethyl modification enzyme